jgi:hypothetical protein
VADNALLAAPFTSFAGQIIDLSTVLIKFTHRVDLDLNGVVSDEDAITFSTNYETGATAFWSIGDLNMDGFFTDDDAILFSTYFDSTLPQI